MPTVRCPRCKTETFTVRGWADLDRCPSCGAQLSESPRYDDERRTEMEVREQLYGNLHTRRRGAVRSGE